MLALTKRESNRGSALITALFIMTLVAIAATAMTLRLQFDIFRTQETITRDRLYLASQLVTFWAISTLSNDALPTKSLEGAKIRLFPSELQTLYPQADIQGELYDMQALFNINNLQDKKFYPVFFKVLGQTSNHINGQSAKELVNAIGYWISPYQPGRGQDEYLSYYQKQNPPYLPGFQPMKSISELRLVQGVSKDIYDQIASLTTVLPEITPININTAPDSLLMSLGNGLSDTELSELLDARGKDGISNLKDVTEILEKLKIPKEQITIQSSYFMSIATVSLQGFHLKAYTLIKRTVQANKRIAVTVINETLNTL